MRSGSVGICNAAYGLAKAASTNADVESVESSLGSGFIIAPHAFDKAEKHCTQRLKLKVILRRMKAV